MDAISLDQQYLQSISDFSECVRHETWTRPQLEEFQAQSLRACREYAYTHSSFYRRFHRGLMDRPLQELPVLTKSLMMEHFDELVTDPAIRLTDVMEYLSHGDRTKPFLNRYMTSGTSGSTGERGILLYESAEGPAMKNSFNRAVLWGEITEVDRVALVTTTDPSQLTAQVPIVLNGKYVPRLQLSANDPLESLVETLNKYQPDALVLYPSIAAVLADEQRQGRLHVAPRMIGCAAETLTGETKHLVEETWQTKIFQAYGTTESGLLAAECTAHQGLHLFEDFSIVEVVDEHNRPVPPGEQGSKVLVTVLFRRTQPLIRYEVSDIVRTSTVDLCPCGRSFALIKAIEGRKAEMLYLPSVTGGEEGINPFLFEFIIDTLPVSGWQVIQEVDGLHFFLTGASPELRDEHLIELMRAALVKREVIVPAIKIHRVTDLVRNASGKVLRMISHVPCHVS
jgi:putative adenylate-forming enzyme